jgi:ABC-type multidrug transport system ATPase subunit
VELINSPPIIFLDEPTSIVPQNSQSYSWVVLESNGSSHTWITNQG